MPDLFNTLDLNILEISRTYRGLVTRRAAVFSGITIRAGAYAAQEREAVGALVPVGPCDGHNRFRPIDGNILCGGIQF